MQAVGPGLDHVGLGGRERAGAELDSAGSAQCGVKCFEQGADRDRLAGPDVDRTLRVAVDQGGERGGGIGHVEEVAALAAMTGCEGAAAGQRGDGVADQAPGPLTGTVEEEQPAPRHRQPGRPGGGQQQAAQRVLARPIQRCGTAGRVLVQARRPPRIFGAGAGRDHAAAPGGGKRLHQGEAGGDPVEVAQRPCVGAGLDIPRQVQQVRGADRGGGGGGGDRVQQVRGVVDGAGHRGAADGVDLEAAVEQRGHGVAAKEAGGAGEQDAGHGRSGVRHGGGGRSRPASTPPWCRTR